MYIEISKMMIRILLSVTVLLAYNGQATAQYFDKECFLIGTLNDYMGHQQTFHLDTIYRGHLNK